MGQGTDLIDKGRVVLGSTISASGSNSKEELISRVNSLPWFHQIDLGNGIITPGRTSIDHLRAVADVFFDTSLAGKSVLDIGCYDGFFSFEAKRRGARRVLATDYFMWKYDPRVREAFEIARDLVAPDLEDKVIDVSDLTLETVGKFDIVLFSGVFYHLRHPFLVLEQIAVLVTETLIVETHLDAMEIARPAMVMYPGTELNNDPTNWWGPNTACVTAMLRDVGFVRVDFQPNPNHTVNRGIFHGRR